MAARRQEPRNGNAPTCDRMSALDASFLEFEDGVSHMHIGSVGLFEGPPPSEPELREMVLAKLHLVPRYRQLVRFVPLRVGRPLWIDDPHFNLDYHLRRTALASPGGERELRWLVGRVMSQQLDRSKPLWEMWAVEGLEDGCWALISKIHHCMVDGMAGTDLISVVLDRARTPERAPEDEWQPQESPGGLSLLGRALVENLLSRAMRPLKAPTYVAARGKMPRAACCASPASSVPRRRLRSTARSDPTVAGAGRALGSPT